MRILYLNHNVIWRSTFFRCIHFARYLAGRGHEVTIFTIHPKQRFGIETSIIHGVRVVQFPDWLWGIGRSGWDLFDLRQRLKFLKHEQYDLVHAFDSRPVVIHPARVLQKRGIPLVLDWADWWGRGGIIEERSNKLIKWTFGAVETWYEEHFRTLADATTVISTALQNRAISLGVKPETILKLHSGADVEHLRVVDKLEARRALGLAPEWKIFGFMGFVHFDLELVLETFTRIYHAHPEARLLLAGKPSPLVQQWVQKEKLGQAILDFGIVPYEKLSQTMGCADVFLLPFARKQANIGRWPNKVGDYMAMGRPIVTSPVGEMEHLFKTEPIGRLAADNAEAFADAAWALAADEKTCAAMGRAAREAAEKRCSWEFLADRLHEFYQRVLERKQAC
jgi:glycosyltransferase involved in cell wall biosynthesis